MSYGILKGYHLQEKDLISGGHPVYSLLLKLKSENSDTCWCIAIYMVSFYQHNISDVAVVSSVIVNGSLDQALRGTLFNCGMNYSKLVYHAQYKRLENSTLSEETQVLVNHDVQNTNKNLMILILS